MIKMKKFKVFEELTDLIHNIDVKYIDLIRGENKSSFIRHRKISPNLIFLFLLAFKGKSLKNELETFYGDISKTKDVTNAGFGKQRMKFNPNAIKVMSKDYIKHYYEKGFNIKTIKGYIPIAGDGSDIIVPLTEENKKVFGYQKGHNNSPAMAKISTMYDCINKVIFDVQ